VGVTQQGHPLPGLGQASRLLARQVGLAAARTAAYLHPVQQLDGPEDDRLLLSEPVGRLLVFQGPGHHIALGQPASGELVFQQVDVLGAWDTVRGVLLAQRDPGQLGELVEWVRSITVHRGHSGSAKSAGSSVWGNTTRWAHRSRRRPPQRGSVST